ncbi:hypothetical protein [Niallia sp. Krafla_26]|uniref:hypothetical protein n=1 Tax=Niallia sp. Krafla_26 TaxID=3064703 RepID=UPI003D170AD2
MVAYLIDFVMVIGLIIGITALNGVITNGIGNHLFGRKKKSKFVDQSARMQTDWKEIGGNNK